MGCGNYIRNMDNDPHQGRTYVKQMPMPPAHQQIDPRLVAAMLEQMQMGQQTPMSNTDSIHITNMPSESDVIGINVVDPHQQNAIAFSRSALGQELIEKQRGVEMPERESVVRRTSDVFGQALGANRPFTYERMRFGG